MSGTCFSCVLRPGAKIHTVYASRVAPETFQVKPFLSTVFWTQNKEKGAQKYHQKSKMENISTIKKKSSLYKYQIKSVTNFGSI